MTLPKFEKATKDMNTVITKEPVVEDNDSMRLEDEFWKKKSLDEMNPREWEALCDGCGRCCLVVLRDDESDELHETDVACRLYNAQTRRCNDYDNRTKSVPSCISLTPEKARTLDWMPETCAYRRLGSGKELPQWHPLITGTRQSVIKAGVATSLSVLSENEIKEKDLPSRVRALRK